MRHEIVEKLEAHLRDGIDSEPAVVYLLVELRKLLEMDGKKGVFQVVNFYCNWVVHTKLSGSAVAEKIIRYVDQRFSGEELDNEQEMESLQWHRTIRSELAECLESYGLPKTICDSDEAWKMFKEQLVGVIEDCPLEVAPTKPPTKFVAQLVVMKPKADLERGEGEEESESLWGIRPLENPIPSPAVQALLESMPPKPSP